MKRRLPAATAAQSAPRSAQIVAEYEVFSTLQPQNTVPSAQSSAAPTEKCE